MTILYGRLAFPLGFPIEGPKLFNISSICIEPNINTFRCLKVKIIRTFKIEKKLVSKSVARRKAMPKFGMSRNDRPGKLLLMM